LLEPGDILFARTGASVGKSYIYDEKDGKVYYAGFLIRARIKSKYNPEFVFQNTLTEKYNNFIRITSQRSGQPGVNSKEYKGYSIMVPCSKEQNQNHQCELVVCSAAESLYYRPQPKRLTERSPLCTTSTHGFFKNLLFLSFLISLSHKWVVLFEYCQLFSYIIIFYLISYLFIDLF